MRDDLVEQQHRRQARHVGEQAGVGENETDEQRLLLAGRGIGCGNLLVRVRDGEIAQVRAVERAVGRGIACAIFSEHRAIAVLHLDGGRKRHESFHPAVERDLGRGKRRAGMFARSKGCLQPADGFYPRCRHGDREFRGFVLDRLEPVRIGAGVLEQSVARAQRAFERVDPRHMLGIEREREPVEKAAALGGRAGE